MSAFYDLASLVLVPSGYKASKVYAQKPLTTDGQLSFTRSTGATRVGPDGLIEKVRTNLLTYSNDFSNANWEKLGSTTPTATSGQADKDGGTDAWLISWGATQGTSYVYQSISSLTTPHTASCWVKGTAGLRIKFGYGANIAQGADITFTGEWQRVSHTSSSGSLFFFSNYLTSPASSFYVQYCQSEQSDIATDYIPTTSAAVSVGPVANVPRLDYLGSSCPRLLLEPQRTNLITFSEQLNLWSGPNVTITANTSQSPDGYQNADNVNITATNGYWRRSPLTFASSTSYAASVFVKKSATTGTKTFKFYYNNNAGAPNNGVWSCVVDLTNITATTTPSGTAVTGRPTILSTNLVDYGNDWYRVEVAFTTGSGAGNSSSEVGFQANGVVVDFDAYGAQLEAGSYATSYCPTLGAAVTRGADACSKTGISSLIGQTEGVIFAEIFYQRLTTDFGASALMIINTDGGFQNRIQLGIDQTHKLVAIFTNASVGQTVVVSSSNIQEGVHKLALKYTTTECKLFLDGVLLQTTALTIFPAATLGVLKIGNNFSNATPINNGVKMVNLYKELLTDAQCIELTA